MLQVCTLIIILFVLILFIFNLAEKNSDEWEDYDLSYDKLYFIERELETKSSCSILITRENYEHIKYDLEQFDYHEVNQFKDDVLQLRVFHQKKYVA